MSNILEGGTTAVPPQSLTLEAESLPEGVVAGAPYDISVNVTNPNNVSLYVAVVVNVTYLDGEVVDNVTVLYSPADSTSWFAGAEFLLNASAVQFKFPAGSGDGILLPPGTTAGWIGLRFIFEAPGSWEYTLGLVAI